MLRFVPRCSGLLLTAFAPLASILGAEPGGGQALPPKPWMISEAGLP